MRNVRGPGFPRHQRAGHPPQSPRREKPGQGDEDHEKGDKRDPSKTSMRHHDTLVELVIQLLSLLRSLHLPLLEAGSVLRRLL